MDWNKLNNDLSENILSNNRLDDLLMDLSGDLSGNSNSGIYRGACPVHGGRNMNFQLRTDGHSIPIYWACHSHHCEEKFKPSLLGLVRGILTYQNGKEVSLKAAIDCMRKYVGDTVTPTKRYARPKPKSNNLSITRAQVRARLQIPSPFFLDKGYSSDVLDSFDIGHSSIRGKTIVPFYDEKGVTCIGFTERSEKPFCHRCRQCHFPADDCSRTEPKWFLPKGFEKSSYLYNYSNVKSFPHQVVLLVEGPGDVLKASEANLPVLASLGCDLSSEQAMKLSSLGRIIRIAYDNDEPGKSGAVRVYQKLLAMKACVTLFPIPSMFKDLGEMPADEIRKWYNQ